MPRHTAVAFSIGNKGYVGTGVASSYCRFQDFWEWDEATNVWTQKAPFAGPARSYAAGFAIGTNGYIGTGGSGSTDFWQWDQATNTWTEVSPVGGPVRQLAVGLSIGGKGYVGLGLFGQAFPQDFWEYTP
jgi:hypothetical protein